MRWRRKKSSLNLFSIFSLSHYGDGKRQDLTLAPRSSHWSTLTILALSTAHRAACATLGRATHSARARSDGSTLCLHISVSSTNQPLNAKGKSRPDPTAQLPILLCQTLFHDFKIQLGGSREPRSREARFPERRRVRWRRKKASLNLFSISSLSHYGDGKRQDLTLAPGRIMGDPVLLTPLSDPLLAVTHAFGRLPGRFRCKYSLSSKSTCAFSSVPAARMLSAIPLRK